MFRVKFYKLETTKTGETRHYLGYKDVTNIPLSDGCSMLARAFRQANVEQKTANFVNVEEL